MKKTVRVMMLMMISLAYMAGCSSPQTKTDDKQAVKNAQYAKYLETTHQFPWDKRLGER